MLLIPKQVTLPPLDGALSTHENPLPTATPATSWSMAGLGFACGIWVPSTSWPCALSPQHHSCLLPSIAQVASPPAAIAVTPCGPLAVCGWGTFAAPLLPIWPASLLPQHATVPSPAIAQVCSAPLAIATAPLRFDTGTGLWKSLVPALPSWP